jgi:tRNA pseudouridine55 synthase
LKSIGMSDPQFTIRNQQAFDGVLIIDKPSVWTSHDVVARVRKILKTRRVGHTGTLDPFATGVLVVCVNRATRLVQFLTGDDKEYLATMRLGFATDTGDLTGKPISPTSDTGGTTMEMVQESLSHFRGRIKQVPPMYSAKKVGGVKLYEMARQGKEIEREAVEVEIKELELIPRTSDRDTVCENLTFRVVCSSGTYIRQLAEDLGNRLGVGAHLTGLRRMRAGLCGLNRAVTLEKMEELVKSGRIGEALIPMSEVLALEELRISQDESREIAHGRSIRRAGNWLNGTVVKLCDQDGGLAAIAQYDAVEHIWHPRVVLCSV